MPPAPQSSLRESARLRAAAPEEVALIKAWQCERDRSALEGLILRHMGRIRSLARPSSGVEREDLVAEGVIALIDAADRFPLDSPVPFAAFAQPALRGAMLRARAGSGSIVSIPERQLRDAFAGRMDETRARMLREAMNAEEFDESAHEGEGLTTEDMALERERLERLRIAVAGALHPLAPQERQLVEQHLLHEELELPELAETLKMTVARARSLEGRALHKMRNILMNKGFVMSDLG